MRVYEAPLPGALILEPKVYSDDRGFFSESWNCKTFQAATGLEKYFVQDNHSRSKRGVLRGLHYQVDRVQAKLVRVVRGLIWDVIIDLRQTSPTFGEWFGVELSEDNMKQLWIPEGFAHGFSVLSDQADIIYKTTDYHCSECERIIIWNDPDLAIDWRFCPGHLPLLSEKDRQGLYFNESDYFL